MKYYTRQRYMELQALDLMTHLQSDENAAVYSEEYFSETYASDEKLFIRGRYAPIDVLQDPQDITCPYDEEAGKQLFRTNYGHKLRMLKEYLTDDIKENVADMRLLALERATPKVVSAANALSNELYARVRLQDYNYRQVFKRNFPFTTSNPLTDVCLHDSTVTAFERTSDSVIIGIKTPNLESQHIQLRFKNAEILHCDGDITGCTWLESEIYPIKKGYEIHMLLLNDANDAYIGDGLAELTLTCSNVHIKEAD